MAKKKQLTSKNIRKSLLSSPRTFLQDVAEGYEGLRFTQAVDTYILENRKRTPVRVDVTQDGKTVFSANLLWVSLNNEGNLELYCDNKRSLYPNSDNVKGAFFHLLKKGTGYIEIITTSTSAPCVVCQKPIEIFDYPDSCPSCGAIAHQAHLQEWIQMNGNCPACGIPLRINDVGEIVTSG
ncbi:MAG: hypothetical protein ACTSVI_06775 [Promethearchaeota archaeon]